MPTPPTPPTPNTTKRERRQLRAGQQQRPMMAELYRQAEAELRKQRKKLKAKPGRPVLEADPERQFHELQVHQVELEMQNVEMQRVRDDLEIALEKYTDLYEFAPVGYFTLTPDSTIRLVNLTGTVLVGRERARLVGRSFAGLLTSELRSEFHSFLKQVFAGRTHLSRDFELVRPGQPPRAVNIEAQCLPDGQECRAVVVDITERKQAEEKVHRSEVRYRRLFEATHDGVLILDPGTRKITEANPFMSHLLGYKHDQLVGKELFEIGLLMDEAASQAMFQKLKQDLEVRYEDLPFVTRGGRHQQVEVVANLYQENGHAVIQCNIRDITARKLAAQELAEKARLLDLSDDAIIVRDVKGCIRYWNHGAEELYGWSRQEALGKVSHLLLRTKYPIPLKQMMAELLRTNRWSGELTHQTRDGRRLTVLVRKTLDRDRHGHPASVLETITDITARKQAEEALRTSEAFNRSVVESSPDCIKLLDRAGNLLSFLHGAQELLGIEDVRPYLNQSWIKFWAGRYRRAARRAVAAAAAGGEGHFVGFFRTLRHEPKWWDVKISPILDANGQPSRLLAVSRDVTERKRAELSISFLASISHELARAASVDEMMQTVGAKIGAQFNLSACAFVEVNEATNEVAISHDWHRKVVPGLVGVHRQADFLGEEFTRLARAGETIVVRDVATDPRTTPEKFAALKIASFLCVPLLRDGQWRFALCLYHSTAYDWREEEIEMARELTARVGARLERLRAVDALRASEERFRTLFNSMDEGYCIIEMIFDKKKKPVDWLFLEVNPSFEKQTGLHVTAGKRMRDLVPDHEDHWFETYGQVARTGKAVRFVNEAKGLGRWFDLYAFRVGGPGSRKVAVLFTNITARKQAEEALSASEGRFRAAVGAVSSLIWTNNAEGLMEGEQPGWASFTGQTLKEYQGYGWAKALHPHDALPTVTAWKRTVAKKEVFEFEHRVRRHDGEWRLCSIRAVPLLGEDGQIREWVGVHTDITERKQAEEAKRHLAVLAASNRKLEKEILWRQAVQKVLQQKEREQKKLIEQARHLAYQVRHAEENERLRISRELHDQVAQTLIGINVQLSVLTTRSGLGNPAFYQQISRTQQLVEKSVETVHRFARELRPSMLNDLGLVPALQTFLKTFTAQTGLRVELEFFAEVEQLDNDKRTVLYRVALEALNNVNRHARATTVAMTILKQASQVCMTIQDNGQSPKVDPMQKARRNNRLGLVGMRERLEMVGGRFEIQCVEGQGTTVRAEVPFGKGDRAKTPRTDAARATT